MKSNHKNMCLHFLLSEVEQAICRQKDARRTITGMLRTDVTEQHKAVHNTPYLLTLQLLQLVSSYQLVVAARCKVFDM